MCKRKTKSEVINETIKPIFPIYLDTMRIKDTISIINRGMTNKYHIVNDTNNTNSLEVEANLKQKICGIKSKFNKGKVHNHTEKYAREHTNASLFNEVLTELNKSKMIANINNFEDVLSTKEGSIVLIEGIINGDEINNISQKLSAIIDIVCILNQSKEIVEAKDTLAKLKEFISNSNASDSVNLRCKLEDKTQILLTIDRKSLIGDTGVELTRGKCKVLGVVYEKIEEDTSLIRDSALSIVGNDIVTKALAEFNKSVKGSVNVPDIDLKIKGPTISVLPIGIYL